MKRMFLLLISLLLISSSAIADEIGIFADATGSSCNLGAPNVFSQTATIIHRFSTGATGSHFKAAFPSGTSVFAFTSPYTVVGNLISDLSLGYGQCLTGSIVLGTIKAVYQAGTAQIVPADTFAFVTYTDCSFVGHLAIGGRAYIGPGDCIIAVESSTWGGVKALYRQ